MTAVTALLLEAESLPGQHLLAGVLLLGFGIAGLVKAGMERAKYRVIRSLAPDAPAAASGLVRMRGRVHCERTLSGPLTGTPCCYYRVEVEEDKDGAVFSADTSSREGPSWRRIWTEQSEAKFRIEGAAGVATVWPDALELDGKPMLKREVYSGRSEAGDDALLVYLQRSSPDPVRNFLWEKAASAFLAPEAAARPEVRENLRRVKARLRPKFERDIQQHNYRFHEYCVLPGKEYEIVARANAEPGGGWALRKDTASGLFLLSDGATGDLEKTQRRRVWSFVGWGAGFAVSGLLVLIFR